MPSQMGTLEDDKQPDLPNLEPKCEAVTDMDNQVEINEEDKIDKVDVQEDGDTTMQDKEDKEKGELEERGEDIHAEEDDESMQSDSREGSHKAIAKARSASSCKDPVTPSERPTRERKTVKRYIESSSARGSTNKSLSIQKGRGTVLKDIPNVAFKLSKRKPDDNLQILHSILFGKKTKAHNLKKNIGMFSGYVWVGNEHEKQRAKVREKLDKCVKEKLLDFCDVLNIPINKATIKKEDLCTKLLEFLESPHATTENLLSDKEKKGNKRKGKGTGGKTTESAHSVAETPVKKQKRNSQVAEKRKRSSEVEAEDEVAKPLDNGEDAKHDDDDDDESDTTPIVESDQEELKSEPDEDESKNLMPAGKYTSKKNVEKDPKTEDNSRSVKEDSAPKSVKSTEKSSKATLKKHKVEGENEKDQSLETKENGLRMKKSSRKKTKVEEENKKDQSSSVKEKAPSKKQQSKIEKSKVESESEKDKSSKTEDSKVEDESEKDKSSLAKDNGQKENSKVDEEIERDKSVLAEKPPRKKNSSTEKEKVKAESKKDQSLSAKRQTLNKKQPSSSTTKVPEKGPEKGKKNKVNKEPSRGELHAVTVDILREVDFNTATLLDIVKLLGTHFSVDLTNRKAEVKDIIAEVISSMTDDDESDGEDENKDA